MSQDPYAGYNPDPANTGGSQPPQNPYETPSQTPYGEPPYQPSPQAGIPPYQVPPQPPYGAYQEFPPYATMPPPNAYSVPGYNPNQANYAFEPSSPLPLGIAMNQLPQQYLRVLTKPSQFTFATEMGKASWDIVWVQLIAYALITGVLSYIRSLIPLYQVTIPNAERLPDWGNNFLHLLLLFTSIGNMIVVPISFFIGQGIIYLLAKAFGGSGTFLRQSYTYLLITAPISIISSALGFIPGLGGLAALALGIYAIILQIFSLMPVHRISGGKATAVVLIPIAVLFVLVIVLVVILVVAIISAMPHSPAP